MTRAVLTFHSLDDSGSVLSFRPSAFASLVDALTVSGIDVVSLDALLDGAPGVALTFDDGMRSVFTEALPVLRERGLPALLFLTTGVVGQTNQWPSQITSAPVFDMMTWDEVGAWAEAGLGLGSHSVTHPDFRTLERGAIEEECARADDEIERRVGVAPEYMAYPYGGIGASAESVARARYRAALSTTLSYLPRGKAGPWRYRVPRLDSYYLQSATLYQRLGSAWTRGYLAARALARRLRGAT